MTKTESKAKKLTLREQLVGARQMLCRTDETQHKLKDELDRAKKQVILRDIKIEAREATISQLKEMLLNTSMQVARLEGQLERVHLADVLATPVISADAPQRTGEDVHYEDAITGRVSHTGRPREFPSQGMILKTDLDRSRHDYGSESAYREHMVAETDGHGGGKKLVKSHHWVNS